MYYYPSKKALTPRSPEEQTMDIIKAFLSEKMPCPVLNEGIMTKQFGSTRIVSIKNPSTKILAAIKAEGYRVTESLYHIGSIDITAI